MNHNLKGALLMTVAMATFTVNDTFMKSLAGDMSIMQAIFLRGLLVTVVLGAAVVATRTPVRLSRSDVRFVLLRNVGEAGAAFLFIYAIFSAPLANMTAILQAVPLTVTLAGALFLGEPVGWRRLVAILVGFAGVMLIVRPGMAGFDLYSLSALGSVLAVTLRDIATRRLSSAAPSLLVAFLGGLGVTLCGGFGMIGQEWAPLDAGAMLRLLGTALFLLVGYILSVNVMRIGDLGFISPFRYTGLLWALVLGFVAFGEWPDALTLIGAAIVIATGGFTLWREHRLSRQNLPVPPREETSRKGRTGW